MQPALTRVMIVSVGVAISACNQAATESAILAKSHNSGNVALTISVGPPEVIDSNGLLITAVATNMGQDTFRYTGTCGRVDMDFRFFDSLGNELQVRNPCEPDPMMGCPTAIGIVLAPGRTASTYRAWTGMIWDSEYGCMSTPAPPGDYKVTVTFPFYQDIEIGKDQVEATATFHWSP
jgi:hypothetical protein